MPEIHPTMTGLETCFEEELSSVPGWHSEATEFEAPQGANYHSEARQEESIETTMVLGM